MAKVEEATETPSVKVLDLAHVPEKEIVPREWSSGPGLYLFSLVRGCRHELAGRISILGIQGRYC